MNSDKLSEAFQNRRRVLKFKKEARIGSIVIIDDCRLAVIKRVSDLKAKLVYLDNQLEIDYNILKNIRVATPTEIVKYKRWI